MQYVCMAWGEMKKGMIHFFWRSLNLLRSQFLTMLFRLISVLISLRPCRKPNLLSSFSSLRNCSASTSRTQESSSARAFSSATAAFCLPSGGSSTSSSRVSPVSQTLCMPKRPVSLTSPWRMMQKWEQGASIWQRRLLASFCLTRPTRSRQTPITRCIFRKKGLKNYSDFIVLQSRSFVLDPFLSSQIASLNLQTCRLQSDASELSFVTFYSFSPSVFVLPFTLIDLQRLGAENGSANSITSIKRSLRSLSLYSLITYFCSLSSFSIERGLDLFSYYYCCLFSRLLYLSSVICGVADLLGKLTAFFALTCWMVDVMVGARSLFFLLVGLRQKEVSTMLPLASASSSARGVRSRGAGPVSQRAYLRLQDWSDGSCRPSYSSNASRFLLSTVSTSRIDGPCCRAALPASRGSTSLLPFSSSSLSIIIILWPHMLLLRRAGQPARRHSRQQQHKFPSSQQPHRRITIICPNFIGNSICSHRSYLSFPQ